MPKYEIPHRYTKAILYAIEADSHKAAVENAVKNGADLRGGDLARADLRGAKIKNTKWPSPTMILLANWGIVKDKLCLNLMRYDASNHPNPKSFMQWAKNGICPYLNLNIQRSVNFEENKELIKKGFLQRKVKSAYELAMALLKEECVEE